MTKVGYVVPGCWFQFTIGELKVHRIKTDWQPGKNHTVNSIAFPNWVPTFTDPNIDCEVLGKVSMNIGPIN